MKITALKKIKPSWVKPFDDDLFEFEYKPLSGIEFQEVVEHIRSDGMGGFIVVSGAYLKILRYGLIDWKNFNNEDGKNIPFGDFDLIPIELVSVISQTILASSSLSAEDKKK